MTTPLAFDCLGSGQPVVFLHAFPFDRRMWRIQFLELSWDYRILAPDFAGFGESPGTSTSIEAMADDVAAWLDAIGETRPIVLGGCSMGGYVALAFARRHAARLRGLMLIDTKAEADDETVQANRTRMIESAATLSPASVMDGMLPRVLGATTHASRPDLVAHVRTLGEAQSVAAIVGGQTALRDRPDARPGLADIRVPTLVIVGAEDVITPPSVAQSMATAIANSRLEVLEKVGHLPNWEAPEEFHEIVLAFLADVFAH